MTSNTDDILHSNHNADSSNPNRIQKPSLTSPPSTTSTPNPRSCVTCRRRKVKCDKKHPCSNCVRQNIDCIFPGPGRAPRKPRKPIDAELIERLKKLEGVVQSLGVSVPPEDLVATSEDETARTKAHTQEPAKANGNLPRLPRVDPQISASESPADDASRTARLEMAASIQRTESPGDIEHKFGRLFLEKDKGRSRYINPSFWASMNQEVEDLKTLLDDTSEDEEDFASPDTAATPGMHQGFMFGLRSTDVNMTDLHPPMDQIPIYWEIYRDNVDPLCKVMHVPTMTPRIFKAMKSLELSEHIPRGVEVLLFSIYYAAVTSLWPEECKERFGEDKQKLLQKYRFGVEQGLARANFLQTDEWIVLQAFVVFLICLRRNDDARVIWTLTGLVVRMAQSLGIHRDGTHYNLTPFQIEMRRRLWWQICILDTRASEDHGCDPTIIDQLFDTKMPLNVDDDDLYPEMTELPPPKKGCTGMSFGLIRFEIASTLRKLQYTPPGDLPSPKDTATTEEKIEWVRELHEHLEEAYLRTSDMTVPLYWIIATVSRLIMSKMWLIIYHPQQRIDGGASLPKEIKDKLFKTSLENIEYSLLMETEVKTRRWAWLFRTYTQWHAIAFLLSELRFRTRGDDVERAWRAINTLVSRKKDEENEGGKSSAVLKSHLWRPMKKLMGVARRAYEQEHANDRSPDKFSATKFHPISTYPEAADKKKMMRSHEMVSNPTVMHNGIEPFGADPLATDIQMYGLVNPPNPSGWTSSDFMTPVSQNSADPVSNGPYDFNMMDNNVMPSLNTNFANNAGASTGGNFSLNDWLGISPSTENLPQFPQPGMSPMPTGVNSMAKFRYPLERQGSPLHQQQQRNVSYTSNSSSTSVPPYQTRESVSVDWESWDNMVQEFGMDVDSEVAYNPSNQAMGNNSSVQGLANTAGMAGKYNNNNPSFMFNNNTTNMVGSGGSGTNKNCNDPNSFGDTKLPAGQMGPWPYGNTFSGLTQWY